MLDKPRKGYYTLANRDNEIISTFINEPEKIIKRIGDKTPKYEISAPIIYTVLENWKRTGYRQVYPSLDISNLCLETRSLEKLTIEEVTGIFPAFAINVPRNLNLTHPTWGHVTHFLIAHQFNLIFPAGVLLKTVDILTHYAGDLKVLLFYENGSLQLFTSDQRKEIVDLSGEGFYISDESQAFVYKKDLFPFLAWVFNIMLLMKCYPNYGKSVPGKIKIGKEVKKSEEYHIHLHKEIKIEQKVLDAFHKHYQETGRKLPTHWRKGYWRRQPNGPQFERKEGVKFGTFEDGREYHLILIPPVLVNKE
jgi:hypothetical protein